MNYLQLCQRLTREAGINLSGPTSTSGNDGTQFARVIDWVQTAYAEIQMLYDDWNFMHSSFQLACGTNDGEYTYGEVTNNIPVARFDTESFRAYLVSAGQSTEQHMIWMHYDEFRDTFRFGSTRTAAGHPQYWTWAPNKNVLLFPLPGPSSYIVTGEYWRDVDELSIDTDEPIFPSQYHMLIVYWALVKYAGFEESGSVYQNAQNMTNKYLSRMGRLERPTVRLGESLV